MLILDEPQRRRVLNELEQIVAAITNLTGLSTNWNGELHFNDAERARGSKPFSCEIVLRADLIFQDVRWRTLIHEALHACSTGYNFSDFAVNRGWEEGVVEKLQRLLRADVLDLLNVSVEESVFIAAERKHPFDAYITALENIRTGFRYDEREFYIELLKTPIKQRYVSLQAQALLQVGEERTHLVRLLAQANVTLTRRLTLELL